MCNTFLFSRCDAVDSAIILRRTCLQHDIISCSVCHGWIIHDVFFLNQVQKVLLSTGGDKFIIFDPLHGFFICCRLATKRSGKD